MMEEGADKDSGEVHVMISDQGAPLLLKIDTTNMDLLSWSYVGPIEFGAQFDPVAMSIIGNVCLRFIKIDKVNI